MLHFNGCYYVFSYVLSLFIDLGKEMTYHSLRREKLLKPDTSQRHNQPFPHVNGHAFYKPMCPTLARTLAHFQPWQHSHSSGFLTLNGKTFKASARGKRKVFHENAWTCLCECVCVCKSVNQRMSLHGLDMCRSVIQNRHSCMCVKERELDRKTTAVWVWCLTLF